MADADQYRDKGYGWVIVFAFFILEVLMDGVRFSFGLFFVEFLSEFNKGKADTAWVGAIMIGVYNLGGPVFAVIVNKIGYRKASILGSIIASAGFLLSIFATDLYHLYFTFGALQGFGYGLAFLAGTVAIGCYFCKRRALAFGISFCGGGVGTFVIPPLLRLLLETYTWRGTMFILAGFALNGCVLSMFYRPISGKTEIYEADDRKSKDVVEAKNKVVGHERDNGIVTSRHENGSLKDKITNGVVSNTNGHIPNESHNPLLNKNDSSVENGTWSGRKDLTKTRTFDEIRKEQLLHLTERTDHGSHRSLNMSMLSQSILGSTASFDYMFERRSRYKMSSLSLQAPSITSVKTVFDSGKRFKISAIENVFPKALVANINFVIFMISSLFAGVTAFVPFSMLPDYALTNGATPLQGAWLLSAIGIGSTVSRVGAGLLSDMACVHRLTLLGVCFLVIGATTVIAALVSIYEVLLIYSTLYGIFFGAVYVVQPIVLLEYFGEQYISEVMGITMSVYGISSFIGSPLAGWIFDYTGSYQLSFLTSGLCFLLSGIINFFVLCTKPSREGRRLANLELKVVAADNI